MRIDSPARLLAAPIAAIVLLCTPPLIAAPTVAWNTFLGGDGDDGPYANAIDGAGNVFTAGSSSASWGNPLRPFTAGDDAFVAKTNGAGQLLWSTFLGGAGTDQIYSAITDASGNLYVAGFSSATWGSPRRPFAAGTDAFVAKLDPNGALLWNTFLGTAGEDIGNGVALGAGNVFVGGYSAGGWGAPVRPFTAGGDAFAAKLDGNGNLLWNTFLGGNENDVGEGIAVDASGNIFLPMKSEASWGNPLRPYSADADICVAKLGGNGALVWNTFLGGPAFDIVHDVAVDAQGGAIVAGRCEGAWGAPVRSYSGDVDICVARVDTQGALTWNTFLGGSDDDEGESVAVDGAGRIYIVGFSASAWGDPLQPFGGGGDVVVARLDGNGAVVWSTFLGGAGAEYGGGVAASGGKIAVVGIADQPFGSPVRPFTAREDGFLVELDEPSPPTSAGIGLLGTYFDGVALSGAAKTRLDARVSFDWGSGTPFAAFGNDTWSVRWNGQVLARASGAHVFTVRSDDGARLFVDGRKIVDDWSNHTAHDASGAIVLESGRFYDIRVEYHENLGPALVALSWEGPGFAREVVPQASLYPYALLLTGEPPATAADAAVAARLVQDGFAPRSLRGATATANDAKSAAVVVVSATVDPATVGVKFRNTATPVVVWESGLFDDFGMTAAPNASHGTFGPAARLRVVAPAHPLAAGLSGSVQITSAPTVLSFGVPNNKGVVVARQVGGAGKPVLFAYERGAAMPGLAAPARRVGLFFGDATAASLGASGWKLFDAAVRWAVGR